MPLLQDILPESEIRAYEGSLDIPVSGVAYDSRKVEQGNVFVAIRGSQQDGHHYIEDAIRAGATAVVVERDVTVSSGTKIRVPDGRRALALIADRFYNHPSGSLILVGVTGTNGKTTTTYLIRSILDEAGYCTGLVGTVAHWIGSREIPAVHTTPESVDLQALLREMLQSGVGAVVLEVSSHALEMDRVLGLDFDIAVFTNLTHDHLDFHGDLVHYRDAKLKLFSALGPEQVAILNADDRVSEYFARHTKARIITYGLTSEAQVSGRFSLSSFQGSRVQVRWWDGEADVELALSGRHNVHNCLAAFATGLALAIPVERIVKGLESIARVPGRYELVDLGQPFSVIVDYAHTPDALRVVLTSAGDLASGRLLCVFGCGGDRDREKRPIMGRIASEHADWSFVTSDNPRTEDPSRVIEDIVSGIEGTNWSVIPDRRQAIGEALRTARPGDVVVVAGKGHEDYQIIGHQRFPFDDRLVVREVLNEMGYGV
jgi:UDP-N-acetylmuramoyl-L-alanyl-D-glutamate--2,6-diaminopimelate ligase